MIEAANSMVRCMHKTRLKTFAKRLSSRLRGIPMCAEDDFKEPGTNMIDNKEFYEWYNKGNEHMKLNRYKKAHKFFDRASKTEIGKKNPRVHHCKGYTLLKLEKYVDALKDFDKAIELLENPQEVREFDFKELDKECFYVLYNKGTALLKLNRYEEAYESFDRASKTKTGKKNPRVHNYKGYALLKLEEYKDALKDFDKAIELLENPQEIREFDLKELDKEYFYVLYNKGFAFFKLKEYLDALKAFNEAIKKKPDDDLALERTKSYIAFAYMELGMYEKAKKILDDAIQEKPESILSRVNLGEFFLDHGDLDSALEVAKKAIKTAEGRLIPFAPEIVNATTNALILRGKIEIEKKQYRKAIKSFEEAIRHSLGNSRSLFWAAYAKYLEVMTSPYRGRWNNREMVGIISSLERAFYLSERDGEKEERQKILYFLGFLYYKSKDFFTAKERLIKCINIKFKSQIRSRASNLLDYIWNYKIKPPWWRWWLCSPLDLWKKRIMFFFPRFNYLLDSTISFIQC